MSKEKTVGSGAIGARLVVFKANDLGRYRASAHDPPRTLRARYMGGELRTVTSNYQ